MLNAFRRCAKRFMSTATEASSSAYPFSKVAVVPPPPPVPAPEPAKFGKGLMAYLPQRTLPQHKLDLLARFGKRHPERIMPGSVLQVTTNHAPSSFTGVVLSIRRRGADTSFVLRNVINRTGVEVQFFVCSPHVKDIKVLMLDRQEVGKEGKSSIAEVEELLGGKGRVPTILKMKDLMRWLQEHGRTEELAKMQEYWEQYGAKDQA
ncbi:hypothetical protein NUW54_g2513 [Trametes sanguinea]|uniref:Uncharacterized protein n=1 Tax=Trametes sanguinea TaxID=158606 RepID=A0ACC1Q6H5_9APHY|nr:hypothetical protein NUW54_g2513 [Trametes sanguinea]